MKKKVPLNPMSLDCPSNLMALLWEQRAKKVSSLPEI